MTFEEQKCGLVYQEHPGVVSRGTPCDSGARYQDVPEPAAAACAFCGKPFRPTTSRAIYCCAACTKKAWTAKRGAERAANRRSREQTSLCECCGRPIAWTPLVSNKRFCSAACKRRHESRVRRLSRCRADTVKVRPADAPPASLDALRGTRSDEYFYALFRLPKEEQWAEMGLWAEEDHAAAAAYLDAEVGRDFDDTYDGSMQDEDFMRIPETPPGAFDEENHFGA